VWNLTPFNSATGRPVPRDARNAKKWQSSCMQQEMPSELPDACAVIKRQPIYEHIAVPHQAAVLHDGRHAKVGQANVTVRLYQDVVGLKRSGDARIIADTQQKMSWAAFTLPFTH
jgi:hypothetical protein